MEIWQKIFLENKVKSKMDWRYQDEIHTHTHTHTHTHLHVRTHILICAMGILGATTPKKHQTHPTPRF